MLNIFANETVYGGWTITDVVPFKEAVPESLFNSLRPEATVTESDEGYGKSVCFMMKNGNTVYKKLGKDSQLQNGDKVNINTCFVLVLDKPGNDTIYRISETNPLS